MFREEYKQAIHNKTMYRNFIVDFGKQNFKDLQDELKKEYVIKFPGKLVLIYLQKSTLFLKIS